MAYITNKIVKFITIDTLVILFLLSVSVNWYIHRNDCIDQLQYHYYFTCGLIFFFCKFLLTISKKLFFSLFFFLVLSIFFYELFLGCFQIIHGILCNSFNSIFICGTFDNSGSYAGCLALCICILYPLCRNSSSIVGRKIVLSFILISLFVIVSTLCRTAIIAVVVSFYMYNKYENYIFIPKDRLKFLIPIGLLFAIILFSIKPKSALGRIYIYVIDIIALLKNGFNGSGLGCFTSTFLMAQKTFFAPLIIDNLNCFNISGLRNSPYYYADSLSAAFNDYLMIGIELGPLTMVLLFIIVIMSIKVLYSTNVYLFCGLTCFFILSSFYFPWSFLINKILVFIIFSIAGYSQTGYVLNNKYLEIPLSFSLMVVFCFSSIPYYIHRTKSERMILNAYSIWYNRKKYDLFIKDIQPLFDMFKHDEQFCFLLGDALSKVGNYSQSNYVLECGLKSCYSIELLLLLGENYERDREYDKAETYYKEAFSVIPNRMKPLWLLSRLYYKTGQKDKLLNLSIQINQFRPKIESDTVKKYREEVKKFTSEIENIYCD